MPNDQTPVRKSSEESARAAQATRNWFDVINPAVKVWANSNATVLTQMSETAKKMHRFTQSRLQANIDACHMMASCRDATELAEHQREFMESAAAQYSEHAQDMSERTIAMITVATKQPAPDLN